ncbi:MAG TPA: pyridoxamine 5'-phosphate oxidase family protein [Acidimicrobiia bacterium]|nr:pyridoxamine 5'-phosphate oxidase family protein [Acidimicrobiia bacterium]
MEEVAQGSGDQLGVVHRRATRFHTLSQARCAQFLADRTLGRIGFVDDHGTPQIYPVTYRFHNGRIYFLATGGSRLAQATSGRQVAFEVDGWIPATGTGWSVLVNGICTLADAVEAKDAAETGLRPCSKTTSPCGGCGSFRSESVEGCWATSRLTIGTSRPRLR